MTCTFVQGLLVPLTQKDCCDGIGSAVGYLAATCVHYREDIVRCEDCLLRYSGYDVSSVEDHAFGHYDCNPPHPSDMDQSRLKWSVLADGIFGNAAYVVETSVLLQGKRKSVMLKQYMDLLNVLLILMDMNVTDA